MKRLNRLFLSVISCLGFLIPSLISLSSCDNSWDGITEYSIRAYNFEVEDTTLIASANEFTLSLNSDSECVLPDWGNGWKLYIGVDDPAKYDRIEYLPVDAEMTDSTLSYDWITFTKILDQTEPALRVSVKENESGKVRIAHLRIASRLNDTHLSGELVIKQRARPDMTPFEMKFRYRGKVYSSMANLDMEEKIVIHDSNVKEVLNRIDHLEGIEMIVQEDGIVDYVEGNDAVIKPALASLRQNVDPSSTCNIIHRIIPTRAPDGFQYMSEDALGYFAMFDDKDFKDSYIFDNLTSFFGSKDIDYMRDVSLNDKVTSLAVAYEGDNPSFCAVLTVWEDSYYNYGDNDRTKHRISFIASLDNPRISWGSLKNLKCIGSSNSWNDRISSFSFHFGYYGTELKPY